MTENEKLSQCEMILNHIEKYGSITGKVASDEYGIERLASRVHDLRHKLGVPIVSEWVTGKNRFGKVTRYVSYTILGGEVQ